MTRTLVTGAAGTIGVELVNKLSSKGINVCAAVHTQDDANKINHPGVDYVVMDLNNPTSYSNILHDLDNIVIILPVMDNMPEITANLCDAAKNSGVKHIIYVSAMVTESEYDTTLGKWHKDCEKKVIGSGIPYTILRPNNFMQNFITYNASTIKSESKFYSPVGYGKISYIDARDLADSIVKVMENDKYKNKVYRLTGSKTLDNNQIAETFSKVLDRKIECVNISLEDHMAIMKKQGIPDWMIQAIVEVDDSWKTGYGSNVQPDIELVLGRPAINFEQFIRDNIQSFN